MYRLMIVDDNRRDRQRLQEILDWKSLGIDVKGIFSNGKQALEKIEEIEPHIILTDIAMPIMNGIEMAKKIKENHPRIKMVFMSCYDDFDFAKSAIDLDINGYILKPFVHGEVESIIKKVLNIYENENLQQKEKQVMIEQIKESLPIIQEEFFKELLFCVRHDIEDIKKRIDFLKIDILKDCNIQIMSIEINEYEKYAYNMTIADKYLISYSIKKIIGSFNNDAQKIYTVQISDKEFASIAFYKKDSMPEENNEFVENAVAIHTEIYSRLNLDITIGMSRSSEYLHDVPELFRQSVGALKTKFYCGGNPIILFDEIEEDQYKLFEEKVNLGNLYKEIRQIIAFGDEKNIEEFIDKYLNAEKVYQTETYFKSVAFSIVNILQINLIEAGQTFQDIFDNEINVWRKLNNFETILDIKQWLYNIFKVSKEHLNDKNNTRDGQIVADIKKIIKSRYHDQFTVNDIAKSIYLSPSQANNIFKKETGKTIFDYLIEYRIEIAKQMLKDPYGKIYLVADKVGYLNKSHFCMLFKKHTGLTPAEYKNRPIL